MKQHTPTITAAAALIRARLNAIGLHTSTEFGGVIADILTATLGAPPIPEVPEQELTHNLPLEVERKGVAGMTPPSAPGGTPAPARKKPKTMAPPKADRVPFGILTAQKAG
jgi:hypothetical protein